MPYLESSPGRLHCEHEKYCPFAQSCPTLEHSEAITWNALIYLMHEQERQLVPVGKKTKSSRFDVYGSELACIDTTSNVLIAAEEFVPNRPIPEDFERFASTVAIAVASFNLASISIDHHPNHQAAD